MLVVVGCPATSLAQGRWYKLICGASFHHLPSIQNLALIFTAAGADCLDMAADPSVVRAAQAGVKAALDLAPELLPLPLGRRAMSSPVAAPWLMASFNDGADPHFRKARLAIAPCPTTCPQPCVSVCPPGAIAPFPSPITEYRGEKLGLKVGDQANAVTVHTDLCYGCGRCEPVCPAASLVMEGYQVPVAEIMPQLLQLGIQAIEIHTGLGRLEAFRALWQQVRPFISELRAVSISLNDGPGLGDYVTELLQVMQPRPPVLIWQTDGRPMSGDLGRGTTAATVRLAQKMAAMQVPGYLQLAGGTNQATLARVERAQLAIAGVAYGSYARQQVLAAAETPDLCQQPALLQGAIAQARELVAQIKDRDVLSQPVGVLSG